MSSGLFVLLGIAVSFVFGTFAEYWIHRLMHMGMVQPRAEARAAGAPWALKLLRPAMFLAYGHGEHHREGTGQGVLREGRDYALGAIVGLAVAAPVDIAWISGGWMSLGFVIGGLAHAVFAAWCHQAQHEDPRLLFWMPRSPVHYVHHRLAQGRHNFGISVDWWDRVFGTYRPVEDWRALLPAGMPPRPFWHLEWKFRPHEARLHPPVTASARVAADRSKS